MKNDIYSGTILITGGTSGLGLELVKIFLNKGYAVIATGRQLIELPDYAEQFEFYQVDFSNLTQVAFSIRKICEIHDFDFVINNAGVLSPPEFTPTINGLEYTFQVNYLAHLLVNEIIVRNNNNNKKLRIVAVTSPVYRLVKTDLSIQSDKKNYNAVNAYASSKLFLTLMCESLPSIYPDLNLSCFSFDPGTFRSGIFRMQKSWFRGLYRIAAPFMRSPAKVAKILSEILIRDEVVNGTIINKKKVLRAVPVTDKNQKAAFRNESYNLIYPFL
jgi:NAD(P)-dependent dehydrogenase (short-subunit alcohol dehydrogenase family)